MHPTFQSYREYVALCLESGEEVPTISEFSGSDGFKVEEPEEDRLTSTQE